MKITVKDIRETAEMNSRGLSEREIVRVRRIGKGSVHRILKVWQSAGISLEELRKLNDKEVINLFYPKRFIEKHSKTLPDFKAIHERLTRMKHRTLLHEFYNYRTDNPYGYEYTWFTMLYRKWCNSMHVKPKLLMNEIPGESMYIDWAGDTLKIQFAGEDKPSTVYFFVTTLGASEMPFIEPFPDMKTKSYIAGHIDALRYYGGIPKYCVPDNCRTAVSRHYDREFTLNDIYQDMQEYYGYVVIPARPKSPTDKNDVEAEVRMSEDWVISELEEHKTEYHSFRDVSDACRKYLEQLVLHKFRGTEFNRREWFEEVDLPQLKPLPERDFCIYEYYHMIVPKTYHVSLPGDAHKYSVPFQYIDQDVLLKYSFTEIRIYAGEKQIAVWKRFYSTGLDTVHTMPEHRPPSHQIAAALKIKDSEYYIEKAREIGPFTAEFITRLLNKNGHPESSFRACMGILARTWHKSRDYIPREVMEEICEQALQMGTISYSAVKNLIQSEYPSSRRSGTRTTLPAHKNIRGRDNYK